MGYYLLKLVITSVLIVAISEIGKKNSLVGAVLASVPLVSVLAMVWLYILSLALSMSLMVCGLLAYGVFTAKTRHSALGWPLLNTPPTP